VVSFAQCAVRRGCTRLKVNPFGDQHLTALDREAPPTTNHYLSDSAVALREKLMHGSPVRVVEVTNVDLKIMSRRTPTDSVLGRRRSPGHRGPSTPHGTAGVGMRELRPPPGRIFGEGIELVVAMTGFFDQLLTRLMTGGTSWGAEQ
jgi:hypothetical protein